MKHAFLALLLLVTCAGFSQSYYLFVGTYTKPGKSKGIYLYKFDSKTGNATLLSTAATDNPSFLALNTKGDHLYATNELGDNKGAVSSFSFDKKNASLKYLNTTLTHGDGPCYVAVDATNKWIATANYDGGSLSVFPVKDDGSVGEAAQVIQHTGSGPNKDRQEKAHVHSTVFTPDNHYLAVADLGMDRITAYPFDASGEKPLSDASTEIDCPPGSGPRHILFDPENKYAYLISELSGNITVYDYSRGDVDTIQTINSHPADFNGDKASAAIHFSPDGKFLYASNRGESNTISMFSVDGSSGKLNSLGFQSTEGNHPRDFNIDPSGNFLLVGNTKSDDIIIFKRDAKTGLLKDTGKKIAVPQPTCLIFTQIK